MPSPSTDARRGRGRPPSIERRGQLLDIAAAMFAREGYHGTSMRALAERAGVNPASLYHYFQWKEDALLEICLTGIRDAGDRLDEMLARPGTMTRRVTELIAANLADLERHADYRHVYYEQREHLGPEQRSVIERESLRVLRLLNRLFGEAAERGELHAALDARQASLAAAAVMQTITRHYIDGHLHDFAHVAQGMADTLIRGLSASTGG